MRIEPIRDCRPRHAHTRDVPVLPAQLVRLVREAAAQPHVEGIVRRIAKAQRGDDIQQFQVVGGVGPVNFEALVVSIRGMCAEEPEQRSPCADGEEEDDGADDLGAAAAAA